MPHIKFQSWGKPKERPQSIQAGVSLSFSADVKINLLVFRRQKRVGYNRASLTHPGGIPFLIGHFNVHRDFGSISLFGCAGNLTGECDSVSRAHRS